MIATDTTLATLNIPIDQVEAVRGRLQALITRGLTGKQALKQALTELSVRLRKASRGDYFANLLCAQETNVAVCVLGARVLAKSIKADRLWVPKATITPLGLPKYWVERKKNKDGAFLPLVNFIKKKQP